jgi:type II secretory ATPase GspE/PulE/Tfp pilus assembly ATPase PilB-like protein
MNGLTTAALPLLAETPAPVFLMSVVKPLVTVALFVPYASLVSGKLVKDAAYYNLKPFRWSATFIGFAAAAFLAAVLMPWWAAGAVLQVALLATPCIWYVKYRNRTAEGVKPLVLYNLDFQKMASERRTRSAQSSVEVRFQRPDRTEHPVPERGAPEHATYLALQEIILPALDDRTQRVDIALSKQGATVSQMTDGIRARRNPIAGDMAVAVVDLLKTVAGLDPKERRKYQRGTVPVLHGERKITLTVSSAGSMQGEAIRVDVERERQLTVPLAKSGMLEGQVKLLKDTLAASKGGVVLVGTRPGQGLTTLGYTLIGGHDAFVSNIKTLERRPERQVEGVEHGAFDPSKAEYSTQLQTIIRRGPDVVLATDAGEPGVGRVVSAPGARSTWFYVLMPSDNPVELLTAWLKAVNDADNAADSLRMVVVGRLVRRLCPACRVAFQPGPDVAKLLALPAGKPATLYRHSGKILVKDQPAECPTCAGTGYRGLTGVYEVLAFDEEARALIKGGDVKSAYLQARRTHRSPTLQEAALMRVRAGDTSLDEVKRVFAPPAPASGGAAAGAAAPRPSAAPAKPPAAG